MNVQAKGKETIQKENVTSITNDIEKNKQYIEENIYKKIINL